MKDKYIQKITGDCINSFFQGFFDKEKIYKEQILDGLGIIIDDQFNFILSNWKNNMINQDSIIRTSCGHIIYGSFQQNLPIGLIAVQKDPYKMFLNRVNIKTRGIEWGKQVGVFDNKNNIFYIVQLNKRDDQQTTLDNKISISETSRYDKIKIQWKIKIIQKCILKNDGTPINSSKYIKKDNKFQYIKSNYTIQQQSQINLLSSILNNIFYKQSIINLNKYIQLLSYNNNKIIINKYIQNNQQQQNIFITLLDKNNKINQKKLGITITSNYIKSIGNYNHQNYLHGLGVQYKKNGQSYAGIFKDNILTKQYKYNQIGAKNISTFTMRELAMQEHLKSYNYMHNTIYLPQIGEITGIANKIIKYIQAFQKQLEKRNINYHDTPSNQSISSQMMNIYKYVDHNRQKNEQIFTSRPLLYSNLSQSQKKPGFILTRSNNKSFQKTPDKNKQSSPSQNNNEKSPLRNIRITGKIYNQTNKKRNNIGISPPRTYTRLKLNEDTYKYSKYY